MPEVVQLPARCLQPTNPQCTAIASLLGATRTSMACVVHASRSTSRAPASLGHVDVAVFSI
eukprot:8711948-Prorocentrum_lima.AAC.1